MANARYGEDLSPAARAATLGYGVLGVVLVAATCAMARTRGRAQK